MKLSKSILLIALFMMTAAVAHGQGAQFKFFWSNVDIGGNPEWYPLLYNCNNPGSDTLRDGTIVRLFSTEGSEPQNPETDLPLVIGHNGGVGEVWPANHFAFNSEILLQSGGTSGSFVSDFIYFDGGTPSPFSFVIYLQIGCWNEDSTEWNCCYYSHRMLPASGYSEYFIGATQQNPFEDPVWTCIDSCPEPVEAIDDPFGEIPHTFEVEVYPNPFNPTTQIRFATQQTAMVKLAVYDLSGREVGLLVNDVMGSGLHKVMFDASGLPSGIYLAHLQTAQHSLTKKLVLLK